MLYFKGDIVLLVTNEKAEILDEWGVARQWYKVRTENKEVRCVLDSEISTLLLRRRGGKVK